jgi:hypothetical protein
MKEKLLSIFSVIPALFAAFCWGGGLILASLGLGTIGTAYLGTLTKYKPIFVVITTVMLYLSYSIMEKKNSNKKTKIIFWVSAITSILIIYYPTILRLFM